MQIFADTHVHIYPHYDVVRLLNTALDRVGDGECILFLAERADCNSFPDLNSRVGNSFEAVSVDECVLKIVRKADARSLFVVAGYQIATAERLEVLSLVSRTRAPDGLNFDESLAKVVESGGVPVLTWAPGKWFGARGEAINRAIQRFSCDQLCLCDTSLRPRGWPDPVQFGLARSKGIKILAGTDPLPISGDERVVASFGVQFQCNPELLNGPGLKRLLLGSTNKMEPFGSRPQVLSWGLRYGRFMFRKS